MIEIHNEPIPTADECVIDTKRFRDKVLFLSLDVGGGGDTII